MKRFILSLVLLAGAAHADTIPDWLRHPAAGCSSSQVVRYLTPGAQATCGSIAFSDLTGVQARVTGSCTAGNAIRVIAADGTVTCQSASGGGGGGTWGSITGTLSDQTDLQTALDAKQPLDADLTAIAALTTTSNGRGFLTLADAPAGRTYLGLGTLATQSGTFSGTSSGTNTGDQTNITGNAGTATALAANPADCAASRYATTIAANGDLTCAQVAYTDLSGTPSLATVATTGAYTDLTGLPTLPANTTSTSHQWFNAYNSTTGAFAKTQPACTDLSDAGTGCSATIANYLTTASAASTYVPQTTTVAGKALSGNITIACGDLSNGATGCNTATGTSGATIPLLNGTNTFSGAQSFNSGDLILKGASSGTTTLNAAAAAGSTTITLPGGTTDFSGTGGTSQVVKQTSSGGALTVARLACSDLSNAAASCSTDATSATNITSGTLPAAQLPNPSASTLGGIESYAAVSHQWLKSISTSGVPASTQPAAADLSDGTTGSGGGVMLATGPTTSNPVVTGVVNLASQGTTVPGTPASATANVFTRAVGNRMTLSTIGPDGQLQSMQNSLGKSMVAGWFATAGSTTFDTLRFAAPATTGSISAGTYSQTVARTRAPRVTALTTSSAGTLAGIYGVAGSHDFFSIGNGSGSGGFLNVWRFTTLGGQVFSGGRLFIGMANATATPTNVDPAAQTNQIGVCEISSDNTQLYICYGGSSAQSAIALGTNFPPSGVAGADYFELDLYAPSNSNNTAYYQLTRLNTGDVASGTLTGTAGTVLPSSATQLNPRSWVTNNATAVAFAYALLSMYIETDY